MSAAIGMLLAALLAALALSPPSRRRHRRIASLAGLRIRRARAK